MVIYVDDFKVASPCAYTTQIWAELGKVIDLGDYTKPSRFLGCQQHRFEATAGDFSDILRHKPELRPRGSAEASPLASAAGYDASTPVRGYIYDMEKVLRQECENVLRRHWDAS